MGGKGKKKRKKRRPGGKKKRGAPLAEMADRHLLYQQSVQSPEADIEFFSARFHERFGRPPVSLREDFCGTGLLTSVWLRESADRRAIAVDRDPEPLAWGQRHNFEPADLDRGRLLVADVRDVRSPRVDIACAMNFSFCVFKRRAELGAYLEAVFAGLESEGVFFCELYGGTEAIIAIEEEREVDDFTFIWEQAKFNPITNETLCHIHFEMADASRIDKAFTYDWRLWTPADVEEILLDVGFDAVDIYWEEVDDDGDGTGHYRRTREEENQEGWLVYLVATKKRGQAK